MCISDFTKSQTCGLTSSAGLLGWPSTLTRLGSELMSEALVLVVCVEVLSLTVVVLLQFKISCLHFNFAVASIGYTHAFLVFIQEIKSSRTITH